jgi:hypothetical protein
MSQFLFMFTILPMEIWVCISLTISERVEVMYNAAEVNTVAIQNVKESYRGGAW